MESLFDQEIKTALQVNIVSYRNESSGMISGVTTYYMIQLSKIYSGEQRYIEKKIGEF